MKQWFSIRYRDFYDVPRMFIAGIGKLVLLFDCPFNQEKDEYEDTYKVYSMPVLDDSDLAGSWEGLPARADSLLGELPVSEVEFDSTRRKAVNLETERWASRSGEPTA